jgi:opacity protein-like surface antigen
LAEWFSFYGGPGLQWASAKAEFTSAPYENPKASTFSLSGRIGVFVRLSQKFGLSWDLGQQFAITSKMVLGKANQLTSSHDGNLGITVAF